MQILCLHKTLVVIAGDGVPLRYRSEWKGLVDMIFLIIANILFFLGLIHHNHGC